MANGRPPDDGSRRSSRRQIDRVANAKGLEALGQQVGGGARSGPAGSGSGPDRVANEKGLRQLAQQIDASGGGKRPGKRSRRRKVVIVLSSVLALIVVVAAGGYGY